MTTSLPFDDSRRLTGPNLHFTEPGVVLDTRGPMPDAAQLQGWRTRVESMRAALGWPPGGIAVRPHASGALLAFVAPADQLLCATEVNEWAWLASLLAAGAWSGAAPTGGDPRDCGTFHAPGFPAPHDEDSARHTLLRFAAGEREPALQALRAEAARRGLRLLLDDELLSLGSGASVRSWPRKALPQVDEVPWDRLHDVPAALVTGSNGKTTTVRLLAAMLRAHGLHCGWNCTDGLYFDGERIEGGDYSGPAGARAVLRDPRVEAAVLETARGGLLRRGLAVERAGVAVVTNISVDHFGEYGIDDLDGLADVKLVVARALHGGAPLVLNADDPVLLRRAPAQVPLAWFALDHAHPRLVAQRAAGGSTCGIDGGHLWLHHEGHDHDLGAIDALPLSFGGSARYNLANMAAASLAATALGVPPTTIAQVLQGFGQRRGDNPGRLQHFVVGGTTVFIDYAHNVDGLRGLLQVADTQRAPQGRLGLLLGQAGNRGDVEIRELADVVMEFQPARVVLKDLSQMLRGRAPGEVPALLREALLGRGLPDPAIAVCLDEVEAARQLLAWARPGDVLVLPLHAVSARDAIVQQLDAAPG